MFFRVIASLLALDAAACFLLPVIFADGTELGAVLMLWPIGALIAVAAREVWND